MSEGDVHRNEMDTPQDFDDATAEALLSGHGGPAGLRADDARLAGLIGDMRSAYASQPPVVGARLAALLTPSPAAAPSTSPRRFERMRSTLIAKAGVATAALFAATGSLAVAHALPAPMQDAASHLGIGAPAHRHHGRHLALGLSTPTTVDDTTDSTVAEDTTVPGGVTTTTMAEPGDDNGVGAGAGSGVGKGDGSKDGPSCSDDHNADRARDGEGEVAASTVPAAATPAVVCTPPTTEFTIPPAPGGAGDDSDGPDDGGEHGSTVSTVPGSDQGGDGNSTPTTEAGSDHGGDSHPGGDHGGSGSGGGDGSSSGGIQGSHGSD